MIKEIEINPVYDLIKILNDNNHEVLEIDDEFFVVETFFPSDKNTPYHNIKGRHITKILVDHQRIGMQNITVVNQSIMTLPVRDIKYSPDFKWKLSIR